MTDRRVPEPRCRIARGGVWIESECFDELSESDQAALATFIRGCEDRTHSRLDALMREPAHGENLRKLARKTPKHIVPYEES